MVGNILLFSTNAFNIQYSVPPVNTYNITGLINNNGAKRLT